MLTCMALGWLTVEQSGVSQCSGPLDPSFASKVNIVPDVPLCLPLTAGVPNQIAGLIKTLYSLPNCSANIYQNV